MMSRKRERAETPKASKAKPRNKVKARIRPEVVLSIVTTDNTFHWKPAQLRWEDPALSRSLGLWHGRCIHCNTKLVVSRDGHTDATIEHIKPLCDGGDPTDPRNLALACSRCNNEKGIRHDMHAGKGGRADEVIAQLQ